MKSLLAILFLSATWSQAETLVQVRNRVDTWLTNHVGGANGLISRQDTYFTNHNRYWQGLITHSIIPTHDAVTTGDAAGDRFTFKPTDQAENWIDILPEWNVETFPAAATIDVYDGPLGKGWVLTVYVRYSGTIYQRRKAFGPDTSYDFAWRVYSETL